MRIYVEEHKVLVMRRTTDNLYFWLIDHGPSSEWGWTGNVSKAYRVEVQNKIHLTSPLPCEYYFENSYRAKHIWCKDSVMEPVKIVVTTSVESLT